MFALANALAHEGRLSTDHYTVWRSTNDWLETAYTDPSTVDAHIFDRAVYPRTSCWFAAGAAPLVARVTPLLELLDAHGVGWSQITTRDPGRIIYDDADQVVVVPY